MTLSKPAKQSNSHHSNYSKQLQLPTPLSFLLSNNTILFTVSLIGLLLLSLIGLSFNLDFEGADSPSCTGVRMSPAYAKVYGFDSSYTRFASKYSLYLYRDQDYDDIPKDSKKFSLSGTPILFIPGNAGSYKQIRSIASEAAYQYFSQNDHIKLSNPNSNNLDFFTADFNEDFTAFHGKTMLDQAEYLNDAIRYILSLYTSQNNNNDRSVPESVIILGHSMGGIVARVMLSLPNYVESSINTIITLSAPHNAAPTTFDGDLLNVFKLTDDFWRNGLVKTPSGSKLSQISKKRLANVSLISITGGILDTTLPTDYTSLTGLVDSEHGFSVSTTGIPGVWTPIDHLAIVWCDQLRKVLAKTMLEIIDVHSSFQTVSLSQRMEIFKSNLLPGFSKASDIMKNLDLSDNLPFKMKIDLSQLKDSSSQRFVQLPKKHIKREENNYPPINLFNIPKDDKFKFNYISSLKPSKIEDLNKSSAPALLLCRTILKDTMINSKVQQYKQVFDYITDDTNQFAELECIDINNFSYLIPQTYESTVNHIEPAKNSVYYTFEIPSHILSSFNNIVLVESIFNIDYLDEKNFVLADLELESSSYLRLEDKSLWKLLTRGTDITIPSHRPIIVDIDILSIRSSLLAYRLDIRYEKSKYEKFSPIISQTIKGETKWHINIDFSKFLTLIINGESPYVPYIVKDPSSHMKLKIFSDSLSSDQLMDIYISVDWFQSLKLMVLKYRLSIIGFPTFITLLIIILQFNQYAKSNHYPSYGEVLLFICNYQFIAGLVLFFTILTPLTSSYCFGSFLEYLDPVERNDLSLMSKIEQAKVELNSNFMGIDEPSLWFYGILVLFISIGLNFLLYNLVLIVIQLLIFLLRFNVWSLFKIPRFQYFSNQRRTISIFSLLILVLIYLPYQFAYIVCVLTQALSTFEFIMSHPTLNAYYTPWNSIKDLKDSKDVKNSSSDDENESESKIHTNFRKSQTTIENYKNFNISFTILMLWLIPINVPVLIVWIHDISLRWSTPFSSHHNILAVLPIIILVQVLNQGYNIPRPKKKINIFMTKFIIIYFALYSLLFGTRHLYFLHTLFNAMCAWFLILIVQDWGAGCIEKVNIDTTDKTYISKLH